MSADGRDRPPARRSVRGRVLLITDRASHPSPIVTSLEAAGFNVMTTAGAAASIVSVSRSRPHLVIVDAGLKGVALGDMVRAIDSLRLDAGWTIPVIVIGDEAATAERQLEAITSGAFDYCQVPANSSLLLARTAQLVALKQTTDRLYEETNKDYLTGLANRRRFRRRLGQELERWRRYKVPCALALVDIDHMKRINDTQGHPAGDIAIRHVGDALLEAAQDNNLAARLGGEEFALLLAGADEAKAVIAAENLRRIISSMPVENIGLITVSIGVSACPAHADSERKLYMAADSALYRAKEEGRNRTAVATQENHSQMEQVVLLE